MAQHFYQPADIAKATGRSQRSVYRHLRQLQSRDLSNPISSSWPMEQNDAERLIEYMRIKRRENKSVTVVAQ